MFKALLQYITALGGTVETFTFDCGQRWAITVGFTIRSFSYECGDEARFEQTVRRWLDEQPWPREDDPREGMSEDTYVN